MKTSTAIIATINGASAILLAIEGNYLAALWAFNAFLAVLLVGHYERKEKKRNE